MVNYPINPIADKSRTKCSSRIEQWTFSANALVIVTCNCQIKNVHGQFITFFNVMSSFLLRRYYFTTSSLLLSITHVAFENLGLICV